MGVRTEPGGRRDQPQRAVGAVDGHDALSGDRLRIGHRLPQRVDPGDEDVGGFHHGQPLLGRPRGSASSMIASSSA